MTKLKKGCVQIYTGPGKGKTTAAIGLGIRAVGSGLKVDMVQLLKCSDCGELHSLCKFDPDFKIHRFEKPRGFFWTLSDEEKQELKEDVKEGFEYCKKAAHDGSCDVLIIDEMMGALNNKLLNVDEVVDFIKNKPDEIEIVMTGRDVPQEIADVADLITEMKDVKHYFENGVQARKGIEY